jgi:hypothetical protein
MASLKSPLKPRHLRSEDSSQVDVHRFEEGLDAGQAADRSQVPSRAMATPLSKSRPVTADSFNVNQQSLIVQAMLENTIKHTDLLTPARPRTSSSSSKPPETLTPASCTSDASVKPKVSDLLQAVEERAHSALNQAIHSADPPLPTTLDVASIANRARTLTSPIPTASSTKPRFSPMSSPRAPRSDDDEEESTIDPLHALIPSAHQGLSHSTLCGIPLFD